VKSSGALKRHRDRNLAAECRRKPKDGSRRKQTAARRGTTCHAGVAQRKVHVARKNQTRENMGRGTSKR
jgi:hypothetical protein